MQPKTHQMIWYRLPIGSMYAIYCNIWGILMVNVTIYGIHGSYGLCYSRYRWLRVWARWGFGPSLSGPTVVFGALDVPWSRHGPGMVYKSGWWFQPTPLKNMTSSVGAILPNIWKNKTCSKPPTSYCHPTISVLQALALAVPRAVLFHDGIDMDVWSNFRQWHTMAWGDILYIAMKSDEINLYTYINL